MDLSRHYYITDDLDELDTVEQTLHEAGIADPQMAVLSRHNADVARHPNLTPVSSFMKRDIVNSGLLGAAAGAVLAFLALVIGYFAGWTSSAAGWLPIVFLSAALFGGALWIGGLYGIQTPNKHFERFQKIIDSGRHVFFVDIDHTQEESLHRVMAEHAGLEPAGTGQSRPAWVVAFQRATAGWWYWRMWRQV